MWSMFVFLCLLINVSNVAYTDETKEKPENRFFDEIIKQILESLRPALKDVLIGYSEFKSGPQEFGELNGYIDEVKITGLENFTVPILNTSMLDINNLTIVEEKIFVNGQYNLNGTLAFPLGKNDIHFFGKGEMRAKLSNLSLSMKMIILFENGFKVVKDFDIQINLGQLEIYFSNLMGGSELETVFNSLINDVGLTVFDYYKQPILDLVKPEIIKKITEMLNPDVSIQIEKIEL